MKFYFAGAEGFEQLLKNENANQILVSYFNYKRKDPSKILLGQDTFLDSGAFTAFSQKKEIDINKYIEYIKLNGKYFTGGYANLDVIGDAEETLANQRTIEGAGLSPIPTVHFGADRKYLTYYGGKYERIALGGLVPYAKEPATLRNWLNKCFKILYPYIRDNGLQVHGFGVGSAEILKTYPFHSADSTGWLSGAKFGTVVTWDSSKYKMISGTHYKDKDTYLKRGASIKLTGHYNERLKHNIQEYLKMEKDLTKLWNSRGIKYD